MKVLKGLGSGLLIGLLVAIGISLVVIILPAFSCTCELISCFFSCGSCNDLDSALSHGCDVLSCSGPAESFPFGMTFIFSMIICTIIGGIWGISTTVSEHAEEERQRLAREQKAMNDRHAANKKEVVQKLSNLHSYAERISSGLYDEFDQIHFLHTELKNDFDSEFYACDQKKRETENIVNNLTESPKKNGGRK